MRSYSGNGRALQVRHQLSLRRAFKAKRLLKSQEPPGFLTQSSLPYFFASPSFSESRKPILGSPPGEEKTATANISR